METVPSVGVVVCCPLVKVACQAQSLALAVLMSPFFTLECMAEIPVLPCSPSVVWILWKWCQYPALKYISVLIFQIREVFWIFCLIHWEVKKYLISLFKFIPGINAFKDKTVLTFFLYFSLSGTFPTMIFYIVVCSTNAGRSLTTLAKQLMCRPPLHA